MKTTKQTPQEFDTLIARAHAAGLAAGAGTNPTPMGVTDGSTRWVVMDGPCGFAWVNVKPGTSAFAKYLVAQGVARKDSWEGGVTVWVTQFDQSWERKRAYALAYAKVLVDAGIRAHAGDRLD